MEFNPMFIRGMLFGLIEAYKEGADILPLSRVIKSLAIKKEEVISSGILDLDPEGMKPLFNILTESGYFVE